MTASASPSWKSCGGGGAGLDADLLAVSDPTELIALVQRGGAVVLVDAVLAAPPGAVMEIVPQMLSDRGPGRLSSHALTVRQALDIGAALAVEGSSPSALRIIAVAIDRPDPRAARLSPAVAAAVPAAARRVIACLGLERGAADDNGRGARAGEGGETAGDARVEPYPPSGGR